jgi:hypothetical protein
MYFLIYLLALAVQGGSSQLRFQPRHGAYLAAASENVVSILDVETQACVRRFEVCTWWLWHLYFYLMTGCIQSVYAYEIVSGYSVHLNWLIVCTRLLRDSFPFMANCSHLSIFSSHQVAGVTVIWFPRFGRRSLNHYSFVGNFAGPHRARGFTMLEPLWRIYCLYQWRHSKSMVFEFWQRELRARTQQQREQVSRMHFPPFVYIFAHRWWLPGKCFF